MAYYSTDLESARLLAYVRRYGIRESDVLKRCRLETIKNRDDSGYMTMPEEAAFLSFFIKATGMKRGLEIGVYTGYSSLSILDALPEDGTLVCCEISQECADIAKSYWLAAGVEHKVTCHVGDAVKTVRGFIEAGQSNEYDFAYIDANKESYDDYFEAAMKLVRDNGTIIIDNMLWGGKVTNKTDVSPETLAIKALNEKLSKDARIEVCLSTMGDGVTFIRKLPS